MGTTSSKVYDLEDKVVILQLEVEQLKEKMGKPTESVEKLEKDMQSRNSCHFSLTVSRE